MYPTKAQRKKESAKRKEAVAHLLEEDKFHWIEHDGYVYVKRFDGRWKNWQIAEFTKEAWEHTRNQGQKYA